MTLPIRASLMENLHINSELADCLLDCTKKNANHWMGCLGIRRDNSEKSAKPTFKSDILTSLYQRTGEVVGRLKDSYPSPCALKVAVGDARFITENTTPILDEFADPVWGTPDSAEDERLCFTTLSWDNEEDRERFAAASQLEVSSHS
jgi:hypothetical protein